MKVYLLSEEQADFLRGKTYDDNSYYNPIQDEDGNWIISQEEAEASAVEWVKVLEGIEYKPKQSEGNLL
jgi:hypothetical protein